MIFRKGRNHFGTSLVRMLGTARDPDLLAVTQ
jgi:hypothetical protein